MHDYDQLFKKLLTTFFGDLLTIVRPPLAEHARLELTSFDNKELFSDLKQGDRRFADLVARLTLDDAAATFVLTHVEVEGEAGAEIGPRMWYYNLQLQLREHLPVFPVVIFLNGGRPGVHWQRHEVRVLEDVICDFRYLTLGLSRMDADAFLAREEPLAWAFAAFTKARRGKAWLKLACLKRIARAGLDAVRQFLLVDAVETRLELKGKDQDMYQQLLEAEQSLSSHRPARPQASQADRREPARIRHKNILKGAASTAPFFRVTFSRAMSSPGQARRKVHRHQQTPENTHLLPGSMLL